MKSVFFSISIALATISLPTSAAEPLFKPGLWEITNKPGGDAGGIELQGLLAAAQQHLAAMDPAQRRQIEAMMARNGVVVDNGGISAKACITPAMAARQQMPMQQKGSCNYQFSPASGRAISYSFSCSSPAASGDGRAVFNDATNYHATTHIHAGESGEHSMTIDSSGRWLGSECGAIAPVPMPD